MFLTHFFFEEAAQVDPPAEETVGADGGGKVLAFLNPIVGLDRVLRMFAGLHRKLTAQPARFIQALWIDGLPGYVSRERDNVLQTTALAIEDGRIVTVFITRNPDKLGGVVSLLEHDGRPTAAN